MPAIPSLLLSSSPFFQEHKRRDTTTLTTSTFTHSSRNNNNGNNNAIQPRFAIPFTVANGHMPVWAIGLIIIIIGICAVLCVILFLARRGRKQAELRRERGEVKLVGNNAYSNTNTNTNTDNGNGNSTSASSIHDHYVELPAVPPPAYTPGPEAAAAPPMAETGGGSVNHVASAGGGGPAAGGVVVVAQDGTSSVARALSVTRPRPLTITTTSFAPRRAS